MSTGLVGLRDKYDQNASRSTRKSQWLTALVCFLAVSGASRALAQCSTDDLDMNGIPDVCPSGANYVEGSPGADFLVGSNADDCIFGLGGNDFIFGLGGNDYICAGGGSDLIFAGNGADMVFGQDGNDLAIGGGGADVIDGGAGNDSLNGGGGNDSLNGGPGQDTLNGGGGTNSCVEEVPGSSARLTNCALITFVTLSDVEMVRNTEGITVTWETTSEVGTVAFRLWRRRPDGELVIVGEIAAAPDGSPRGARYLLRDDDAPRDGAVEYILEERTVSGGSAQYGPFKDDPQPVDATKMPVRADPERGRVPHRVALRPLSPPTEVQVRASTTPKRTETPIGLELLVGHSGIIELDVAALAEGLQMSTTAVAELARSGGLDLRLGGDSIAWQSVDDGSAIRFVAPEVRSPFSRHHHYFLSVHEGLTMESGVLVTARPTHAHRFIDTRHFEENVFPGPSGGPDPRMDLFFWHALSSEAQVSLPIDLPALAGAAAQELRVVVHAATSHPGQPHRIELHWNGESLGIFDLLRRQRHTIKVSLDGVATGLDNELVVEQHVAGEAPPVVYVDSVEVDYARWAEADAPEFRFASAVDGLNSVTGLRSNTTLIYDVTNPRAPRYYGQVPVGSLGTLSFQTDGSDLRFLAAAPETISAPLQITPRFAADLRSQDQGADYVIISASHLLAEAEELRRYREADGYRVKLIDVDDVYWEFANGEPDPLAIRDFLEFASKRWSTAPRFVTLVGGGSLDYRDLLGLGGNWISPALAETDGGLFPSDSMLGDIAGDDGIPEIAIGRLPITTGEELHRIISAIKSFEANHASMDVLFSAGNSERSEFAAASHALRVWAAPSQAKEIDLETEGIEEARTRLFSMWGSLSWMNYIGHSGLDRLAADGLLTVGDVPVLAETQGVPVVLAWSCNMLRFDIPGVPSLGTELLANGATAGVFSATGWSNHVETDALRSAFVEAALASDAETIGDAMTRAHRAASGAPAQLHRVYMLLGDPALRLRGPNAQPDPASESPSSAAPPPSPAAPGAGPRPVGSGPGCAITVVGNATGPAGWGLWVIGMVLALRRRWPSPRRGGGV